jgi:hypothetical protein
MAWSNEQDPRYGDRWNQISAEAKRLNPICCFCMKEDSRNTHHIRYVNNRGNLLLNKVTLGKDIFCVCLKCHKILHSPKYYRIHQDNTRNHNTKLAVAKLKFGYHLLYELNS